MAGYSSDCVFKLRRFYVKPTYHFYAEFKFKILIYVYKTYKNKLYISVVIIGFTNKIILYIITIIL